MRMSYKCPICEGSGFVEDPRHARIDVFQVKKEMAIKLHGKGFSLRQIQKALGYKSVRSVHLIIKELA